MTRAERRRELMAEWRTNQGARGAAGIREVMRALEHIAKLHAPTVRDGDRLRLGHRDLRIAQHRAISQERRRLHGEPPANPEVWWEQISAIASQWGIATTIEDWQPKPRERVEQPVEPAVRYSATEAA